MKTLPATIDSIPEVVKWLQNDGVIAHPTDTCYGFAALASDKKAVEKLRMLKGNELEKPLSILVLSLQMAEKYAEFPIGASRQGGTPLQNLWPAPLTLLLPKRETVPAWVTSNRFIGVRVPDHKWTLRLIEALGEPIVTSSTNRAGEEELYDSALVAAEFENEEVLLIEGGIIPPNPPSTIVRIDEGSVEVLRQGILRIY